MTHNKSGRIDAETYAPLAYNGDDPSHVIESRFGMKLPEKMGAEFTQAFQAASPVPAQPLKTEDVWKSFKEAYILPKESAVFYATHDTHIFGDGSKFVSVSVIKNDEMQKQDGDGDTCAEAVVDAFNMTGRTVTRKHGIIDAPDYGRQAYAIVGVSQGDGRTYFGVGIAERHQTAEVMAATRACGRALYAAQPKPEAPAPHPQG